MTEENDLEIVVGQPNLAGDLEISAIVAHARDERETGAVFGTPFRETLNSGMGRPN